MIEKCIASIKQLFGLNEGKMAAVKCSFKMSLYQFVTLKWYNLCARYMIIIN